MSNILIFLVIGLFVALLFLNVYFRVKVLKNYKKLVQNKVEFGPEHIFNLKKLNTEILPKYPSQQKEIRTFVMNIRNSLLIALILVGLITVMGVILKNY